MCYSPSHYACTYSPIRRQGQMCLRDRKKGVYSLESRRQQAIDSGVEFIACQMSMDVMGVKREELLDNITVGGVASYMERAEQANVNLFI